MRSTVQLVVLATLVAVACADVIPFQNCSSARPHIQVSSVALTPYPAQAGDTELLNVTGTADQPIVDGTFSMSIVFMGAPVYTKSGKVCEMGWFNCPAPQGSISLLSNFSLPVFIPEGDFSISANLTAPDGSCLLCISFVMPVRRPSAAEPSIAASEFSAAWWEEQVKKTGKTFDITFSSAPLPAPAAPAPSTKPADHTSIQINDDTTTEAAAASTPAPAATEAAAESTQAEAASESPSETVAESTEATAAAVSSEASAESTEAVTETVSEAATEATEQAAVTEESTAVASEAASETVSESVEPAPAEEAASSSSIPAAELSEQPVPTIPSPKAKKGKNTAHLMKQAKALEEEFDSIAAEVDQAAHDLEHHTQQTQPHVTLLVSEDAAQDGLPALPMIIKQVQEALGKGEAYLLPSSPANTVTIPLHPVATDAAPTGAQWPWSHDWELGDVEWTALDKETADSSHKRLAEIHHRYANDQEEAPRAASKKKKKAARVEEPSHITFPFAFVNSDDSSTSNVEADTSDSDNGVNYFLPNLVHALSRVGHDHEDQEVEQDAHQFQRPHRGFERDDRVLPVVAGEEDQSLRDYFQQAYGQIADVLSLPSNSHFTVSDHNSGQDDNPHGLAFPFPPSFRLVH